MTEDSSFDERLRLALADRASRIEVGAAAGVGSMAVGGTRSRRLYALAVCAVSISLLTGFAVAQRLASTR